MKTTDKHLPFLAMLALLAFASAGVAADVARRLPVSGAPISMVCIGDELWEAGGAEATSTILKARWARLHPACPLSIQDFSVAGDTIVSLEARFNQQPVLEWTRYWPLLLSKPNWVLLHLGGRDTASRSVNHFRTALVPPEEQRAALARLLGTMRRLWPQARIVLLTPLPENAQARKKAAAAALSKGARDVWRRGDPEKVGAYIQVLREVAAAAGCEVLDLHSRRVLDLDVDRLWNPDRMTPSAAAREAVAEAILLHMRTSPPTPPPAPKHLAGDVAYRLAPSACPQKPSWSGRPATIPDSHGAARKLLLYGNVAPAPDGTLAMDGKTTGGVLEDSTGFTPENGATLIATVRNAALTDPRERRMFSSYFYKSRQFLFCRVDNQLYFNLFANGRWCGGATSPDVFEEPFGQESFHQVALTIRHHHDRSQGENWIEVRFFLDGVPCGRKRLPGLAFAQSPFPLECGSASSLGAVWRFKGDAAEYRIYHRVLNDSEIEDLASAEPLLKQRSGAGADAHLQALLAALPDARRSAAENLVRGGMGEKALRDLLARPGAFWELRDTHSTLTILAHPGKCRIVSWYDHLAGRELLAHDSPMFTVVATRNATRRECSPLSPEAASSLAAPPVKNGRQWTFTIESRLAPNGGITARTRYVFGNGRLQYDTTLTAGTQEWALAELNQPALRLRPFTNGGDRLLVPIMSGVEYPEAARNGATYDDTYPHGTASMQLGAYYDRQGGLYWTALDPRARAKRLEAMAGRRRIVARIGWTVPGDAPRDFTPEAPAVVELFRGDWYDVGLLYRHDLAAMKALWWRPSLPNLDTPQWFRDNCFILRKLPVDDPECLKPMRDFFGMPYAIAYSSSYAFNIYSPFYRLNQMDFAYLQHIHSLGLHAYPYTDPRLWSHTDRRDEDWQYSRQGKNNVVRRNGREHTERYGEEICSVVCPATPAVQEITLNTLKLILDQGFDGLYCDQIGAAAPQLCEHPAHGHRVRDPDAWHRDGWHRIFTALRQCWTRQGEQKILVTEDNGEHCVRLMDGLLPWRWMYENQVPLFPMVYAGRTQFTGREPDCEEPGANFVKAAVQLVNSEQLGWIESGLVVSPLRHEYRVFLRQLLWLRKAMLPFFNEGLMARPPRFARPWPTRAMRWGVRGTGVVSSPAVVSSAWRLRDAYAVLLVNHTGRPQENALHCDLPRFPCTVTTWHSDRAAATQHMDAPRPIAFTLAPRSAMLLLAIPDDVDEAPLVDALAASLAEVRKSPSVPDPFRLRLMEMASMDAGHATAPHPASDLPDALGCRLNRERNQVDYVRDAILSVGEVDFAGGSGKTLRAAFAAPPGCGSGSVEFFVDDLQRKNRFASFPFDGTFTTRDWNTFEDRRVRLERPVAGRHRVFIILQGSSFCNFRSWCLETGDSQ